MLWTISKEISRRVREMLLTDITLPPHLKKAVNDSVASKDEMLSFRAFCVVAVLSSGGVQSGGKVQGETLQRYLCL